MDSKSDLLLQAESLIRQIDKWRAETTAYRWLNIALFMLCKIVVPAGSLVVAANLTASLFATTFINNTTSTVIAIAVTVLASIEVLLNPAAKKRVAFTLNNELRELKNCILIEITSSDEQTIRQKLIESNANLKSLLNKYSENGY
jgi:hypothetical protein